MCLATTSGRRCRVGLLLVLGTALLLCDSDSAWIGAILLFAAVLLASRKPAPTHPPRTESARKRNASGHELPGESAGAASRTREGRTRGAQEVPSPGAPLSRFEAASAGVLGTLLALAPAGEGADEGACPAEEEEEEWELVGPWDQEATAFPADDSEEDGEEVWGDDAEDVEPSAEWNDEWEPWD